MSTDDTTPAPSAKLPCAPTNGGLTGTENAQSRHAALLARIAQAAHSAGRDPSTVQLLAVSKTFGPDAILALAACGQRDFGENYLQEALPKMAACAAQASRPLQWHFIGPIQSNKTRPIAEHFDWVHSVERERVAARLNEQRPAELPPLHVCIQVDVSGEATKSGCDPLEALALARAISAMPRLRLRGLMAIPAPSADPVVQRAQFARVKAVYETIRSEGIDLDTLSMGMSGDLEEAIGQRATIVRVGTALFGSRPPRSG
jgi:pyridoxal phosphate enzyme (YggS family)